MATIQVKNSVTGALGTNASKDSRGEKNSILYGKIPETAYSVGDTLDFLDLAYKDIIHAEFVSSTGETLKIFTGANLSSPLTFDVQNSGDPADISYVIHYVRGAGVKPRLRITVASS